MQTRSNAICKYTPATDLSAKEGYGVTLSGGTATIGASATVQQRGIILEGGTVAQGVTVAICGAFAGACHVKITGTVTAGALLQQSTDGSYVTDAGTGARVVAAVANESGVSGDLIEAFLITPTTLS